MRATRRTPIVFLIALAVCCQRRTAPGESAPAATRIVVAESASAVASSASSAAPSPSASAVSAERPPLPDPERAPPVPSELVASPPRPFSKTNAGFSGPVDPAKDAAWITRLGSAPITEIVRNPGGATLTFKVKFADGQRAVWKPDQTHSASNFRAEIAAYHLDRLLGFGRTAVVVGRNIGYGHVHDHLEHSAAEPEFLARFEREVKSKNGIVAGALIAWHAGKLANAEPPRGWMDGLRKKDPPAPEIAARLGEWSDLMVFDFLIDNTDRWSGGNVLSLGNGGPLIFLDNAAAFSTFRASRGQMLSDAIEPLCRFRRQTRDAVAHATKLGEALERSLARDPLAPILAARNFSALDERVQKLEAHIDACITDLGEDVVVIP